MTDSQRDSHEVNKRLWHYRLWVLTYAWHMIGCLEHRSSCTGAKHAPAQKSRCLYFWRIVLAGPPALIGAGIFWGVILGAYLGMYTAVALFNIFAGRGRPEVGPFSGDADSLCGLKRFRPLTTKMIRLAWAVAIFGVAYLKLPNHGAHVVEATGWWVGWAIVWGVLLALLGIIICLGLDLVRKSRHVRDGWDLLRAFLKDKKDKVCPILTFVD
ncbi:MAG: hypothetical protein AAB420_01570 [Patescibacteria group bacterium]